MGDGAGGSVGNGVGGSVGCAAGGSVGDSATDSVGDGSGGSTGGASHAASTLPRRHPWSPVLTVHRVSAPEGLVKPIGPQS